jgi:hypothetical protein
MSCGYQTSDYLIVPSHFTSITPVWSQLKAHPPKGDISYETRKNFTHYRLKVKTISPVYVSMTDTLSRLLFIVQGSDSSIVNIETCLQVKTNVR